MDFETVMPIKTISDVRKEIAESELLLDSDDRCDCTGCACKP